MIDFIVNAKPFGKKRPRVSKYRGVYSPPENTVFERIIRKEYMKHYKMNPTVAPIQLDLIFYFKRPRAMKDQIYCLKKPDFDNLAKSIADALNGYAYHDDCQIVLHSCQKLYAQKDMIHIRISKVNNVKSESVTSMEACNTP
jgi:Holliday junction resolvase RusA-like endonuclease